MAKRYVPKDMTAIIQEMDTASPRAAILVGVSLIEYTLEELLRTFLREAVSNAEKEVLFAYNGLAGTFSEKIWLAYFLCAIGPETRRELDLLRAIRNECAHNMNSTSFDNPAIADRCRGLMDRKPTPIAVDSDMRKVFLAYVAVMSALLLARSILRSGGDPAVALTTTAVEA